VILVKLTPAELTTTDVTRITLKIGAGDDGIDDLFIGGLSVPEGEEAVVEEDGATSGPAAESELGSEFSVLLVPWVGESEAVFRSTVAVLTVGGSDFVGDGGKPSMAEGGRCGPFAPIEAVIVPSGKEKKSLEVWQHPTSGRFVSQQNLP
jgi:hypothetical protein